MKKLLILFICVNFLFACKKNDDSSPTPSLTDNSPVSNVTSAAKNTVFFGSDTKMYAFNSSNGTKKWEYDTGFTSMFAPVASGDVLYFTAGQKLYALDANTGTLKWSKKDSANGEYFYYSPVIANGTLYIGNGQFLFAINATDGTIKWKTPNVGVQNITLGSSSIYVMEATSGKISAYKMTDGTKLWETTSILQSSPNSSASLVNGVLYVADGYSGNSKLYAIDASNGSTKWQYSFTAEVRESPTVVSNVVYIAGRDGKVYAIDAGNGNLKWSKKVANNLPAHVLVENSVLFANAYDVNDFIALNTTDGSIKWKITYPKLFDFSGYVVMKGTIFIGNDDGNLYALNSSDGTKKWDFKLTTNANTNFTTPCAVDDAGLVYFAGDSGMQQ